MIPLVLWESREVSVYNDLSICDGTLKEDDFEGALWHQLLHITKPIVLNTTNLNGKNPTGFFPLRTLQYGRTCLGRGHDKVQIRGYKGYSRFDFMIGPVFIQVSVKGFGKYNKESADFTKAFDVWDHKGTN
ncbi:MAG: hypothetical protein J3R72DRAFT_425789 [Linnemannia gamsii]|nr:MAG: hypothetical protein J3R72DRAFT_425789 [Linnemannia gamsii]